MKNGFGGVHGPDTLMERTTGGGRGLNAYSNTTALEAGVSLLGSCLSMTSSMYYEDIRSMVVEEEEE